MRDVASPSSAYTPIVTCACGVGGETKLPDQVEPTRWVMKARGAEVRVVVQPTNTLPAEVATFGRTPGVTNDLDFQQSLAQLFTLIPYAQLVLEQARAEGTPEDLVDLIFATFVRDFSATAIELHGKASSTEEQQAWALGAVRKPEIDRSRDDTIYSEVRALADTYEMRA